MAIIPVVVDVLDAAGNSLIPPNVDGTKPLLKVRLAPGLVGTFAKSGDTGILSIAQDKSGGVLPFTGSGTTIGASSVVVVSAPLADDHAATIDVRAIGRGVVGPKYGSVAIVGQLLAVESGVLSAGDAATSFAVSAWGFSCAINPSWAAGSVNLTIVGPMGTITAAADNGSGKVRLTIGGLTNKINGKTITVAGLGVCTEANGDSVASFVDATHLDLAAISIVHTGADSGTAVLTTPPTIAWGATLTLLPSP